MNELPYLDTATTFQQELKRIATLRKNGKTKSQRVYRLTKEEKKIIHTKTGGKCHVSGQ